MSEEVKKTCFSCLWSYGTLDAMNKKEQLYCLPSGYIDKMKKAEEVCDEYFREIGADEKENV